MKRLLAGSFALLFACGGAVEPLNGKENPPTCLQTSPCEPPRPPPGPPPSPPYYELCGFAGKVNDGEWCPAEGKGESCESFRQPTCVDPLPTVQCTCDGTKFVCGLPPKCPPPSVDAGKPD